MNGAARAATTVDAYGFLSSILAGVAQPVWVVDPRGDIRFANPAAVSALGYDDVAELDSKPSHETIHYKRPDGSHFPVEECPMLAPRQTGETIHSAEDWFVRRDGTMFPVEYWSAPIDTSAGRGAVVAFTDIEERRQIEEALRERDIADARAGEARAAQRRIIEAADAARARLTRDLHDGAQQQFLNTVFNLQRANHKLSSAPQQAKRLMELAIDEAQSGIAGLRDLAAGVHPAILTSDGLAAALDALAARLPVRLELAVADVRLPPPVEASVYFFCSEALTNITKHARAESARIEIALASREMTIEITDDGIGVTASSVGALTALRDRVAALEGALDVTHPPSGGTTLNARIPIST